MLLFAWLFISIISFPSSPDFLNPKEILNVEKYKDIKELKAYTYSIFMRDMHFYEELRKRNEISYIIIFLLIIVQYFLNATNNNQKN